MGQFSWLDCKTKQQIIDNKCKNVFVLIPKEFGGGHIKETCYDGYGHFGGYDIFDLVADWNRKDLSENSDFVFPYSNEQIKNKDWYEFYADTNLTREEVVEKTKEKGNRFFEWRYIGIALSCYDEDNEALPFPIKITYDEHACYELCLPSKSDPNQGWEYEEDEDEDDWY
jgi:hypothetical protein